MLNRRNPARFDVERVRFVIFPMINMLEGRIFLANWSKSFRRWRLICISFCFGVGINLSPFASKLIWSFVSSTFERVLICFLSASVCSSSRSMRNVIAESKY